MLGFSWGGGEKDGMGGLGGLMELIGLMRMIELIGLMGLIGQIGLIGRSIYYYRYARVRIPIIMIITMNSIL